MWYFFVFFLCYLYFLPFLSYFFFSQWHIQKNNKVLSIKYEYIQINTVTIQFLLSVINIYPDEETDFWFKSFTLWNFLFILVPESSEPGVSSSDISRHFLSGPYTAFITTYITTSSQFFFKTNNVAILSVMSSEHPSRFSPQSLFSKIQQIKP